MSSRANVRPEGRDGGRAQRTRLARRKPLDEFRICLDSQNVRGLNSDKEEECVALMKKDGIDIKCLQETWQLARPDSAFTLERGGFTFVHSFATRSADRGRPSGGIAICLNGRATSAWRAAGNPVHRFGDRVMAVTLNWGEHGGKTYETTVVCAYAPVRTSGGSDEERRKRQKEFLHDLSTCVDSFQKGHGSRVQHALFIGGDFNASLGVRTDTLPSELASFLGPWGVARDMCDAGLALLEVMAQHTLCAVSTFFQKKRYATWKHPRDGDYGHQLDHWLVPKAARRFVHDVCVRPSAALDSDHLPVRLVVVFRELCRPYRRQGGVRRELPPDVAKLRKSAPMRRAFSEDAVAHIRHSIDASSLPSTPSSSTRQQSTRARSSGPARGGQLPGHPASVDPVPCSNSFAALGVLQEIGEEEETALLREIEDSRPVARGLDSWSKLQEAIHHAARKLPRRRVKPVASWFAQAEDTLMPLVHDRNAAAAQLKARRSSRNRAELARARGDLRRAVREAKRSWIEQLAAQHLPSDCGEPGKYWQVINELRRGLDRVNPVVHMRFKGDDGELCMSDEANAEVARRHFDGVYNRRTNADHSVLELVRQRDVVPDLADEPSKDEVAFHLRRAKSGKAPGDNGIPAELLQALAETPEGLGLVHSVVLDFWRTGDGAGASDELQCCFQEWCVGRLKLLPKKGDPSNPSNWRGIMLLDVMAKVVASIIQSRLDRVLRAEGVEYQHGFRGGRGCSDGIFALKMALLKRREHGLGSWVLFVDLIKAFDSVDRSLLLAILGKFGVPDHLVCLIGALHTDVRVKLQVGSVAAFIDSTVGVKQGDNMAPILFLFVIQAAMETLQPLYAQHGIHALRYHTLRDGVTCGRPVDAEGEAFDFWVSLYADDAGMVFESREHMQLGARLLKGHLARFALEMHCGLADADGQVKVKSKTEAVYFPPHPSCSPSDDDIAPLRVDDHCGIVTFTQRFRYLGSILDGSLSDEPEVVHRVQAATAAFARLKQTVFNTDLGNSPLPSRTRGKIYNSLVLGILLYGCESWVLTEMLRAKLEAFHNRCVRAMCGVTRTHVRSLSGGHEALRQRLGIPSMQLLISTRKLRWAGHVVRMDAERLPRKFFSSWIKGVTRPRGRCMSYGHDLARELRAVGFNLDKRAQAIGVSRDWVAVAQDRDVWRRVVAEGSCSCLDSEGGTPSGVAPPCMSVNVSSCYELSVTEVSTADANPSSSQSSLAADQQPPSAGWAGRLRPRPGRRGNT